MWFFFVLIFDMVLLGILVVTEGRLRAELFPYLLLINPTDIFRLVNLVSFEVKGTGLLSIASDNLFSLYELIAVMLTWIIVLFSLAYYRLLKRPI
jgi:Cu-processing system permease protein